AATVGAFTVDVDTIAPTAGGTFSDVTTGFAPTYDFQVTYSDDVAIDVSTLDDSDVRALAPTGFNQPAAFVGVDRNGNGRPRTAPARRTVPNGGWYTSDNGTYMTARQPGQVGDTGTPANFVAGGALGTFPVNVDTIAPAATATAPNVTTGLAPTEDITVTYSDNVAIDVSTLDGNDDRVLGPNAFDQPAAIGGVDFNSN